MKKIALLITLFSSFIISTVYASALFKCQSTTGFNKSILTLYIVNHELVQFRSALGGRPRALFFTKIPNQETSGVTFYLLAGHQVLSLDNAILNEENGNLELPGDQFFCSI